MRKELAERKAIEKLAEPKTKPKIEPQDPASHEKPKYQHESRKARAARDLQDGLQAYRVHRALEELAACKAREESTAREMLRCRESLRMRNLTKTQERRRLCETPKARDAREAGVRRKARSVRIKERKAQKVATVASARTKPTALSPTLSLPYLLTPFRPEDGPVSMPAHHWRNVELEHSRPALTDVLESLIPTANPALVLAYGHHFRRATVARLSALDTSRPLLTADRTPYQPVPCFVSHRHLQYRPEPRERRDNSSHECAHTLAVIPRGTRRLRDAWNLLGLRDWAGWLIKAPLLFDYRATFTHQANRPRRPREPTPRPCEPIPFRTRRHLRRANRRAEREQAKCQRHSCCWPRPPVRPAIQPPSLIPAELQIFVRTLTGRTITLEVDPSDSIGDLKTKIQDKDGVPTGRLRLVLAGRQLGDGCLAADCRLAKGDTLHLLGSLRGGTAPGNEVAADDDDTQPSTWRLHHESNLTIIGTSPHTVG